MTHTIHTTATGPLTVTLSAYQQSRWVPGWITWNLIFFPSGPRAKETDLAIHNAFNRRKWSPGWVTHFRVIFRPSASL
jgi:hypothetical protein